MRGTYLTVAGRIRQELGELQEVAERISSIWEQAQRSAEDDYHVDAVALNLHGLYTGVERLFELIANRIDQAPPEGGSWHQELLEQMTAEIPNVRPAVLPVEVRRRLDPYRGFRHVVRNVYTMRLDPQRIALLVQQLPATMKQVSQALQAFAGLLEQLALDG